MAKKKWKFSDITVEFDQSKILDRLKKLRKDSPEMFKNSMERMGIQFLTWASTGSPRSNATPPVLRGVLKGSGAVYVGERLVRKKGGQTKFIPTPGIPGDAVPVANPATIAAPPTDITWSWNTPYAARLHETSWEPGPVTKNTSGAGNKWLQKHLEADGDVFWEEMEVDVIKQMYEMKFGKSL